MLVLNFDSFSKAYEELLSKLAHNPEYIVSPRGQKVNELTNVMMTINNPLNNLYLNTVRSSMTKYIAAECVWYFRGVNSIEFISDYAKMWKALVNTDNKTVNSAYGYQLFNTFDNHISEWQWAYTSLANDMHSRQAIMHINKPHHNNSLVKDYPCTLTIGFLIRDDKLNMTVHMRSNDVILGLPTDFAEFSIMHQQMYRHLSNVYKNLQLGSYTHIVDSLHLYERHYTLVNDMLDWYFITDDMPALDIDLIDYTGKPNTEIIDLYELNEPTTSSQFIQYLYEKINLV